MATINPNIQDIDYILDKIKWIKEELNTNSNLIDLNFKNYLENQLSILEQMVKRLQIINELDNSGLSL